MASDIEQNKKVVRAFAEAINVRDWHRLDELIAIDFKRHSYSAPSVNSRDELKRYLRSEFEIFPDAYESIEDMVGEGDKVAVRHRFRGTQHGHMGVYPPSGKVMEVEYLAIYRVSGGVVTEAWAEWDNLAGLIQLGHFKPEM